MIHDQKMRSLLVLLLSLGVGTVACGDDGGSSSSNKTPKRSRRKGSAAAKPAATAAAGATVGYEKVSDELRHQFTEADFVPDPSGETNRDPFHSWVLRPQLETSEEPKDVVDVCTEPNVRWGAENYSVRDLSLVGLVKRGRSYAQFTDKSDTDSWIVRKGDCIGQEKAVIDEIGVGYVRLTITPEAPPGSPAPRPQTKDIPLHPEQLELPGNVVSNFDDE